MAGIRGQKPFMPVKPAEKTGLFKQRGAGPSPSAAASSAKSAAYKRERKDPSSGRNSGTSPGTSHYTNMGLKDGTSKRG